MNKWLLAGLLQLVSFGCESDEPYEPCVVTDAGELPPDAGPVIDFGCSEDVESRIGPSR